MQGKRIYGLLRRQILTCELPPGRELREQELALAFDVSKSPVREALQKLTSEGLVIVVPRQGYRVVPISLRDTDEMFSFRLAMELLCVAEAVKNASDEELEALDRFREFGGDYESGFITYDHDFHCTLARCSGNGRMARTACDLIEETERIVQMTAAAVRRANAQKLVEEHNAVISALQERDSRRAVSFLRSHVAAANKRFSAALEWTAIQG